MKAGIRLQAAIGRRPLVEGAKIPPESYNGTLRWANRTWNCIAQVMLANDIGRYTEYYCAPELPDTEFTILCTCADIQVLKTCFQLFNGNEVYLRRHHLLQSSEVNFSLPMEIGLTYYIIVFLFLRPKSKREDEFSGTLGYVNLTGTNIRERTCHRCK